MAQTAKKTLNNCFKSDMNLVVELCVETRLRGYQPKSSKTTPSWPSCK